MTLSHNSLFVLHPSDEMPLNRRSNKTKTLFKHDVPKFGVSGKLSCALVFCYTTRIDAFNALTGKKKTNIHDAGSDETINESDVILNQYFASENCKNDQIYLKQLYMNMEKRYKK